MVRLTDGRNLRATRDRVRSRHRHRADQGRIDAAAAVRAARRLRRAARRASGWCAIGNPLAYEHTVTVGVVSFIGRKLFDSSLDHYIQTDAAINFGNSGGPLINARGEVIGINAAISSRAANIGFAVPINQARAILPQLREKGRVSRGYIGVALRDVDPDLQRSLGLSTDERRAGAGRHAGSPGARAGVRPYDLIVAVDGKAVERQRPADSDDRRAAAGHRRDAADPARRPSDERAGEAGRAARCATRGGRQAARTRRRSRRASAAPRSACPCASSIASSPNGSSCPRACRASSSRASSR